MRSEVLEDEAQPLRTPFNDQGRRACATGTARPLVVRAHQSLRTGTAVESAVSNFAVEIISGIPASARDTGHSLVAASAYAWNCRSSVIATGEPIRQRHRLAPMKVCSLTRDLPEVGLRRWRLQSAPYAG